MPRPLHPDHVRRRLARLRRTRRLEAERRARKDAERMEAQRYAAELSPTYIERVQWIARVREIQDAVH